MYAKNGSPVVGMMHSIIGISSRRESLPLANKDEDVKISRLRIDDPDHP
jgi:hypothetical protein